MIKVMQDPQEIAAYAQAVKSARCKSYLEIGSKHGGSLAPVAAVLEPGSVIVSVDLPNGTKEWSESSRNLTRLIVSLNARGHDARVIWGDSTDPKVIEEVGAFGPYDGVFIDANHTLPYVTHDWEIYGKMARKLVAFHDISWRREPGFPGTPIDVPQVWESLKGGYRHDEFRFCPTRKNNGIGVLWM